MVPVIHHDFEVAVGKSRVPICTITKREFKGITPPSEHYEAGESLNEIRERLRLQHVGRPRSKSTSDLRGIRLLQKADVTQVESNQQDKSKQTTSTQPRAQTHDAFATLKDALRLVPIETGFLIEVKYPTLEYQQRHHITYPDRNSYADAVLTKIFDPLTTTPTNRPIILISFDADMCTILAAKQPRYPIMFVIGCDDPQFGTDTWRRANPEVEAADIRTQNIEHAAVFAKQGSVKRECER
jgi:glycerophosphoryl diester phosphodiesterase